MRDTPSGVMLWRYEAEHNMPNKTSGFHKFPLNYKRDPNGVRHKHVFSLPAVFARSAKIAHKTPGALEADDVLVNDIPAELFPLKTDTL
jgi:hypothetical protein